MWFIIQLRNIVSNYNNEIDAHVHISQSNTYSELSKFSHISYAHWNIKLVMHVLSMQCRSLNWIIENFLKWKRKREKRSTRTDEKTTVLVHPIFMSSSPFCTIPLFFLLCLIEVPYLSPFKVTRNKPLLRKCTTSNALD